MALKSQKKSFVYKPRTADQVKARATKFTSNFDSVFKQGYDTFRPHDGDNLIRYLPATWDHPAVAALAVMCARAFAFRSAAWSCMAPATALEVSTFLTARDLISARGLELRVAF